MSHTLNASSADQNVFHFDIPRQSADSALTLFAEQANLTLIFPFDKVQGITANRLVGRYTQEDAVQILLRNTPLTPTFSNQHTLNIKIVESGKPAMNSKKSLLAAFVGFLASVSAHGQDAEGNKTSVSKITSLEEIVVTARRRAETAQESPVPLTVLNDTLLDRYGVTGIDSIASFTPGLVTGESSGAVGGSISLRGVGSGESQAFIDQAVSINIDGIAISTAQILRVAQMDLKQIEVLRGPQALFFGKNSPGGIISLTTADPGDDFEMMLRSGYEFEGEEWSVDGTISGPISDTVGFRLAAHYSDMDGYFDVESPTELIPENAPYAIEKSGLDGFPKREEMFLRGTLVLEPTEQLKVTLKGTLADTEVDGSTSYFSDITHCPYGSPQELYPVASNCKNDGKIIAAQIPDVVLAMNPQLQANGHRDSEQTLFSATIEYDLTDTLTLTSVTGYYDAEEETSSHGGYGLAPSNVYAVNYENEQFSEELRLASNYDGAFNFIVGGFYEERELYTDTYIVIPTAAAPACPVCFELPFEATSQDQESLSVFAQFMYDLSDQVQLSVGGRYTREEKEVNDYVVQAESPFSPTSIFEATPVDVLSLPSYIGKKDLDFSNFSPEVTVTYTPTDNIMYFASYKEGYKSGGFDGSYTAGGILSRNAVNTFDPEEVSGFEVGMKSSLADSQVILNLTGYWYDYEDLQVAVYDTAARSFSTGNAAESRVRGIEIETKYLPKEIPGLELHASANFNDAKFEEFFAQCYKSQSQALGCDNDIDVDGFGNTQDLSGEQLRKAPRVTATVGGYFETSVADSLLMSFSTDLSYSGKYNYGTDYQPYTEQSSYTKVDASIRLFTDDEKWELALIGRNLTDKYILVNGIDRTGTGGDFGTTAPVCSSLPAADGCIPAADVIGTPTRGRSVTLQATYRY